MLLILIHSPQLGATATIVRKGELPSSTLENQRSKNHEHAKAIIVLEVGKEVGNKIEEKVNHEKEEDKLSKESDQEEEEENEKESSSPIEVLGPILTCNKT